MGHSGSATGSHRADGGPLDPASGFFDGSGAFRGLTTVYGLAFDADGRIVVAGANRARETVLMRVWQ